MKAIEKQIMAGDAWKVDIPAIKMYNRLEARPVSENFDRTFKAEIRDPLWMLSRQWQLGEFQGEDAASPAQAKIGWNVEKLEKYKSFRSAAEPFDHNTPLEAKVEKRPVRLSSPGNKKSYNIRMMMGRHWLKLLENYADNPALSNLVPAYVEKYPLSQISGDATSDAHIKAHPEIERRVRTFAGRMVDGGDYYEALSNNIAAAHQNMETDTIAQEDFDTHSDDLEKLALEFIQWYNQLFYTPDDDHSDAWDAERLEYRFDCSSLSDYGENVYSAEEYYHGKLDWYNFEANEGHTGLGQSGQAPLSYTKSFRKTFIPAMIHVPGAPDTRWWAFEEGKINLSDMDLAATDLNKLLFVEFGLIYANDWFILPLSVEVGAIIQVRELVVTDVFGDTYKVPSANQTLGNWDKWTMYSLQKTGEEATGNKLMILPSSYKVQESPPLEKILFAKDEMSNLVWAIEKTIEGADGRPKNGDEAAREMKEYYLEQFPVNEAPANPNSNERYRVMSEVNENWIPFIATVRDSLVQKRQLQRGTALRALSNENYEPVQPRTNLVGEGLADSNSYFINEEEIGAEGIMITQTFQRTRWLGGKVFTWLGNRKQTGRGEGYSGLFFDTLANTKKD